MHTRVFFRRGKRVGLAMLHEDDLPFLMKNMNDPAVTQYLKRRLPLQWQEEREYLARVLRGSDHDFPFGIALIKTGKLIGMMGLHRVDWIVGTATTGAWIHEEKNRGRGYGSEAKGLLLDYAFLNLGLRKICSNVHSTNGRSRRYNEKCGYHVEGVKKAQVRDINGEIVDQLCMAVYRPDWERVKETASRKKR